MYESERGRERYAGEEGLKDLVVLEPPPVPEPDEDTQEVPAVVFFAARASTPELRVAYRALEIWLLEAPSLPHERELAWRMHHALERELERRVRESIWPRGEEEALPF
ncbi:hypothetical protein [Calidithermus chliarophilus]|uniref:hypothetical protein n=1 Tax=Calidithermus chliarophilus TaxID=52023 RepID=UPI0004264C29|nr:hypothetical protein [Calidithermus chliarophilus]